MTLFKTNVDKIIKQFTRLDEKLNTHISDLYGTSADLTAQAETIYKKGKEVDSEIARAERIRINIFQLLSLITSSSDQNLVA